MLLVRLADIVDDEPDLPEEAPRPREIRRPPAQVIIS
jgi:hypothetical protein